MLTIDNLEVEVTRKKIKNIYLKVTAPEGKIKVSAPLRLKDQLIHKFVLSRKEWIQKQLKRIQNIPPQVEKKYESQEIHFFQGRPYILEVIPSKLKPSVSLTKSSILLRVAENSSIELRKKTLENWYRLKLKEKALPYIKRYEPIMNVSVSELRIKKMKTRWGTCNIRVRRIWLSLELIKKAPECLEYLIVHEMTHLLEPSHNHRFHSLMSTFLPEWPNYKALLKQPT